MIFHNSPNDMAKVLVQYIDCAHKIHREIMAHYDKSPCIETIRMYRATYNRRMLRSPIDHDPTVVWMDERYTDDMAKASQRLARAIIRARAA